MSFDLRAGIDAIDLTAVESSAYLGEVAVGAAAHFRDPTGHVGAWVGIGYALPVLSGGTDPTNGMVVNPQPRLDLHAGIVLAPVFEWDVYLDGAVIGRGDTADPATQLPILDGGFSQRQVTIGVVHHFKGHAKHDSSLDPLLQL
jgi:hypothetical protein